MDDPQVCINLISYLVLLQLKSKKNAKKGNINCIESLTNLIKETFPKEENAIVDSAWKLNNWIDYGCKKKIGKNATKYYVTFYCSNF